MKVPLLLSGLLLLGWLLSRWGKQPWILPVMLGAKDVAFPRMNLASFYLWVFGLVFFIAALLGLIRRR